MLNYLKKYQELPKDLRDKMSNPAVVSVISELEKKYNISLATFIMKVMVKEIAISDVVKYFIDEFKIEKDKAEQLEKDLKEKVFSGISNYLNIDLILEGKEELKEEKEQKSQMFNVLPNNGDKPAVVDNSFFSKEDEEEIKQLSKKIGDKEKNILHENSIDEKLDKIIKETQINFGSEELVNRLKSILKTYVRGIRGRVDVKQTLMKPLTLGGLDVDPDATGKILKAVDNDLKNLGEFAVTQGSKEIKPPEKIKTPDIEKEKTQSLKNIGARDVDYDLKSLKPLKTYENTEIGGKELINKLDEKKKLAPLLPAVQKKDKQQYKKINSFFMPPATTVKYSKKAEEEKPIAEIKQIDARRLVKDSGKIKMEDVKPVIEKKFTPKVMGPVDELGYMDLTNFRRIDINPKKTSEKIKETIKLLEEESYTKRLDGIKAWRNSPVNKIYLEMGQESIGEAKPISAIIETRGREGKEFLKEDEFNAVADLNKELRF
ncbi:MAG: hypothetical protein ABIA02_03360 [Candidatus Falkowbacteria bacterium]